MTTEPSRVVAAIPARWGSTRFPGKALAPLAGEPMIAHVVRRALAAATVDHVLVATDDERVAAAAEAAGAEAVLTGEHPSGTDRVAAALAGRSGLELVVNVQGDEPLLSGANIDALVAGMRAEPEVGMATLCRPLPVQRADDPNAVKVVLDGRRRALYFSRSAIPYPRDREAAQGLWRLHLGIYGFRPETLARFVALEPSPLERAEGLEQLRALENGISILVLDAPDPAFGVDTPEDLARAAELLRG
ncbi:MAG TPA: 3-deoxy-manno-octulosonate cytidylyltransferase [Methylomirabilota bacterium]|nr:3-deoxy-manno-octulosonate cytidylyltransferase [Methylomirabilota bacterium]